MNLQAKRYEVKESGKIFFKLFASLEGKPSMILACGDGTPTAELASKMCEKHVELVGVSIDVASAKVTEALTKETELEPARSITWAGQPAFDVTGAKLDVSKATIRPLGNQLVGGLPAGL